MTEAEVSTAVSGTETSKRIMLAVSSSMIVKPSSPPRRFRARLTMPVARSRNRRRDPRFACGSVFMACPSPPTCSFQSFGAIRGSRIPLPEEEQRTGTIAPMWDWLIWGSLVVATFGWIGAAARTGVRAVRLWREVKRTERRVVGELDALAAAAESAAARAEAAGAGGERLTRSLEHLAASRRRLAVLQQAFDEAQDVFGGIAAVYPRK